MRPPSILEAAQALCEALNPWYGDLVVAVRDGEAGASEAAVSRVMTGFDATAIAAALRAAPPAELTRIDDVWQRLAPALPPPFRDPRPYTAVDLGGGVAGVLREHLRFTQGGRHLAPLATLSAALAGRGCVLRGGLSLMSAQSVPISAALATRDDGTLAVLAIYSGDGV